MHHYTLRHRKRLTDLDRDTFNALCIAVLKRMVSPDVIQTSSRGADAMRDAVLYGRAANRFAEQPAEYWIFQFKQYEQDTSTTRNRALADFKGEARSVFTANPACAAYGFLTSVSFSAKRDTGLFDRVQTAIDDLKREFGRFVFFWDSLEINNLVNLHEWDYVPFFDDGSTVTAPAPHGDSRLAQTGTIEQMIDSEKFQEATLSALVPPNCAVLSPSSASPLWQLAHFGRWHQMRRYAMKGLRFLSRQRTRNMRAWSWLSVAVAWADSQVGDVTAALRRVRAVKASTREGRPKDVEAWLDNIESICFGKTGDEVRAELHAVRARQLAEESGSFWLAHSVQMRQLHRRSWHAWESGASIDDADLDASVEESDVALRWVLSDEREYMIASREIVKSLHYSWRPALLSSTQALIQTLLARHDLPADEVARLTSEYGRITLFDRDRTADAISWLRRAIQLRAATGHLPRLRYDLLWLGEAYARTGNTHFASACSTASLRIHTNLYASSATDTRLVTAIIALMQIAPAQPRMALASVLEEATGVPGLWWSTRGLDIT